MMPGLEKIYDRAFFEEWGKHHARYVNTAERVAEYLYSSLRPGRIVDLGSGCGVYSHFFRKLGTEVLSIDGVRPPEEEAFPGDLVLRDLTEPIDNIWGAFDFTLCFDVAEHIPQKLVDPFLGNLTRFSPMVLLSAAPPNQGGTHHVNEQPKRYWTERLKRFGFAYNRPRTGSIVEHFKKCKPGFMWMCQHISVYERNAS